MGERGRERGGIGRKVESRDKKMKEGGRWEREISGGKREGRRWDRKEGRESR